ncbi:MAG: hypothetical protein COA60_001980 [Robiginitomaculum sp.]|nr:hypothetical protein [Robiginitomaculum sp.]
MLFLFNDVVLEIGQPVEVVSSANFPMPIAEFDKMPLAEISLLAKEAIFTDLQLVHSNPTTATHIAVLLAAKSAANAVLIGPPANGARTPAEIGIRLAEISLVVMSNLWQLQVGNTLSYEYVYQAVWSSLNE